MTRFSNLEISKFDQSSGAAPLFEKLALLEEGEPGAAAWNMALDEALLSDLDAPLLRFYRWRENAVSFGCFEKYAPLAPQYPDRALVRRWTGGGVVLHGADCTYSLLIPAREPLAKAAAAESYREIHRALARSLQQVGFAAELVNTAAPKFSAACFENAVACDVMLAGRKIAGAAQRRTRAGLLHQGSVQLTALPADFPAHFAHLLAPEITPFCPGETARRRAHQLVAMKYGTAAWTQKY